MEPREASAGTGANRTRKARRRPRTYTVGFRLDEHYIGLLEKSASVYGISLHEYARQRLTELLDRTEEARVLAELAETRATVNDLREDLARSLEVILVNMTHGDASSIRTWIDANLRRG